MIIEQMFFQLCYCSMGTDNRQGNCSCILHFLYMIKHSLCSLFKFVYIIQYTNIHKSIAFQSFKFSDLLQVTNTTASSNRSSSEGKCIWLLQLRYQQLKGYNLMESILSIRVEAIVVFQATTCPYTWEQGAVQFFRIIVFQKYANLCSFRKGHLDTGPSSMLWFFIDRLYIHEIIGTSSTIREQVGE